jgi:hypothetical protein
MQFLSAFALELTHLPEYRRCGLILKPCVGIRFPIPAGAGVEQPSGLVTPSASANSCQKIQ